MTFTFQIKEDIFGNRLFRARHKRAQAYGLLLFSHSFNPKSMLLFTEHKGVSKLYANFISTLAGLENSITILEQKKAGREIFSVKVDDITDRRRVLDFFEHNENSGINLNNIQNPEDINAFFSGVFLACGNITDPVKAYHLEMATPSERLARNLCQLLTQHSFAPKLTQRRGNFVVYFRDSAQIEEFLAFIGAQKYSLEVMSVKIYKEIRNKANRQMNCDSANIDKTLAASRQQLVDIRYIIAEKGLEYLSDDLKELASKRLENTELSLRELGEQLTIPLSRSGVNHRLKRISVLAQAIREKRM